MSVWLPEGLMLGVTGKEIRMHSVWSDWRVRLAGAAVIAAGAGLLGAWLVHQPAAFVEVMRQVRADTAGDA